MSERQLDLNGPWKNVYDIPETPIETKVPSTVYGTLLEKV